MGFVINLDGLTPRECKLLDARLEHYIANLYHAKKLREGLYEETGVIEGLIIEAEENRSYLRGRILKEHIEPRQRPRTSKKADSERPTCYLFLDECGGHESKKVDSKFPVFCLSGLVVTEEDYTKQIAPRWNGFKARYLHSIDARIHEPSIRGKRLKYFLSRYGSSDPASFESTLHDILSETNYTLISTVIRKDEHKSTFGEMPIDMFLPLSQYHIALDFILERFVHYLHNQAGDARGIVIAERIGDKETAQLKHEYARLRLEGTQYISPSWFRYQLSDSLFFADKNDLIPGLEMTDIIARPTAEKVKDPSSVPVRWEPIKTKFYDGTQGRPESYGLKVFPTPISQDLFE